MDFNSSINIHNHMCAMERYAYALALCASDKLGDCNVCYVFFFFLFYRLNFLKRFLPMTELIRNWHRSLGE